jgi:hypothetical protein
MKVIKDHLCSHFCDGDGRGELCASSEDEAQNEGVYAASNPPTNGFGNGSRMGVSGANKRRLHVFFHLFRMAPTLRPTPRTLCRAALHRARCEARTPTAELVAGVAHATRDPRQHWRRRSLLLPSYFPNYHGSRTNLALGKDCPETRPISPPAAGKIIAVTQVGGLHHRYERCAA